MLSKAVLALALILSPALAAEPVRAAEQTVSVADLHDILIMLRMAPSHYRPGARYGGNYGDAASQAARRRIAEGIARDHGLTLVESWPMPLVGVDCFVMRVPDGRDIDEVVAQVSRDRAVAWSQRLQTYHTLGALSPPRDPLFAVQPTATQWRLADLHRIATGAGVTIAVIDSKIDVAHPDLAGQFVANRDFLTAGASRAEPHGTGIAGVIAAKEGNGVGIVGVAPRARLMALRACAEQGRSARDGAASCDSLTLAKALHFAIDNGADVINLSLSGPQDTLLASLVALGISRRIAIVAAYDPGLPGGGFPASQSGVLAIAEETLPSLPERVYRAPGRDVPITQPGGRWGLASGNSFATAQVSGLLALASQRRRSPGARVRVARSGDGVVNACATLVAISDECDCSCAVAKQGNRRAER